MQALAHRQILDVAKLRIELGDGAAAGLALHETAICRQARTPRPLDDFGLEITEPRAIEPVGRSVFLDQAFEIGKWPVLLLFISAAISLVYREVPSRQKPKWRWVTWGSAFAGVAWLVMSILFSWYASHFGSYNKTYGSLGAAIGFMTWMWLSFVVILLGAELDAEMEHQTARDTTTGAPRPIGQRGARVADTVGAASD